MLHIQLITEKQRNISELELWISHMRRRKRTVADRKWAVDKHRNVLCRQLVSPVLKPNSWKFSLTSEKKARLFFCFYCPVCIFIKNQMFTCCSPFSRTFVWMLLLLKIKYWNTVFSQEVSSQEAYLILAVLTWEMTSSRKKCNFLKMQTNICKLKV